MQTTDLLDTVLVGHIEAPPPVDPASSGSHPSSTPKKKLVTANSTNMTVDSSNSAGDEAKCPVDHKTREAWLQQARAAQEAAGGAAGQSVSIPHPPIPQQQQAPQAQTQSSSWSSWLPRIPSPFSSQPPPQQPTPNSALPPKPQSILDENREISSIPRAPTSPADPAAARPSNHEIETGASSSGKWIYPSEKMFFEAMKRKGNTSANPVDMKTVVPIHNAVNERAWKEILQWEAPYNAPAGSKETGTETVDDNGFTKNGQCGGPRLHSFAGLSTKMTPRARINTLLGYQAPFDRHDWVVERCGTQVEYVIDFYSGRNDDKGRLNFYLDVRPKLNSWEGVKMRFLKFTGLV